MAVDPAENPARVRSPLEHRRAELAESSVDDVTLAEETELGLLVLRGQSASPGVARAWCALGIDQPEQPVGAVRTGPEVAALRLGPEEWLLAVPGERTAALAGPVHEALADSLGAVTEVTSGHAVLGLSGARARDVLEKLCSIDLHPRVFGPGRCARTLVGRVEAVVWQREAAVYRLIVARSYAEWFAEVLREAMAEFTVA